MYEHTGTTSNYAGTCVLFKCKVQTGKAAQRACVRAVLRCKGEGLHLDMSGLGTAGILSRAVIPSHADSRQTPPPSAAGQEGAFEAPDTLHLLAGVA